MSYQRFLDLKKQRAQMTQGADWRDASFTPSFSLCMSYPNSPHYGHLLTLDEDDIAYFTQKALRNLEVEKQAALDEVEKRYSDVITTD